MRRSSVALCAVLAVLHCMDSAAADEPSTVNGRTSAAGIPAPPEAFPLPDAASAGNGYDASSTMSAVDFGLSLFEDFSMQLRAPFRYAKEHPWKFTAGTLGVMALILTDHQTYPALHDGLSARDRRRMQRLSEMGDGRNGLYLIAGLGFVGIVTGSSGEKGSALMLAEALVTSALWTDALKTLSGRERPREMEEARSDWEGPGLFSDERTGLSSLRSFPSGHSTGAWAAATILAHRYPSYGVVPALAYGGATAMSYSRIAVGAHWLSDVAVGALIGIGSARAVIAGHEQRSGRSDMRPQLRWGVDASPAYQGVHLKYDF